MHLTQKSVQLCLEVTDLGIFLLDHLVSHLTLLNKLGPKHLNLSDVWLLILQIGGLLSLLRLLLEVLNTSNQHLDLVNEVSSATFHAGFEDLLEPALLGLQLVNLLLQFSLGILGLADISLELLSPTR